MYTLNVNEYRRIGVTDTVINWLEKGVPLPFESEPPQCFNCNRVYTDRHAEFVDSEIV